MNINPQRLHELKIMLKKIDEIDFYENDIKNLLILLRSMFKGVIGELANFIAHPEFKDRGPSFSFVERIFVKISFYANKNKIDLYEIVDAVFERIILNSLYDIDEKELKHKFNLNRNTAKNFLNKVYKKEHENSWFYHPQFTDTDEEHLAFELISFLFNQVPIKETINSNDLINQIKHSLSEINSKFDLGFNIKKLINKNKEEILFCISCMLHYSEFKMPDGEIPRVKLKFSVNEHNNDKYIKLSPHIFSPTLQHTPDITIVFEMMFLNFDVKKYLLEDQLDWIKDGTVIETMETFRDDNKQFKIKIIDCKNS